MNILLIGATGFIGTNLALKLSNGNDKLFLLSMKIDNEYKELFIDKNVEFIETNITNETNFDSITKNIDTVYHLFCSCVPANSNLNIKKNIINDVEITINLLDSMVKNNSKKIIFISSGGAIYGNNNFAPNETTPTNPITAYGIQKNTIEKLLFMYQYNYGLDYRIIRLSNPYGKYQKPNSGQGLISTFVYNAMNNLELNIYGDGTNVRDYIYIDDAINGIINIAGDNSLYKIYNLGSGKGTSINEIVNYIKIYVNSDVDIKNTDKRISDVKSIILEISRYAKEFGNPVNIDIEKGIKDLYKHLKEKYGK